jgi:hypothetical protein
MEGSPRQGAKNSTLLFTHQASRLLNGTHCSHDTFHGSALIDESDEASLRIMGAMINSQPFLPEPAFIKSSDLEHCGTNLTCARVFSPVVFR